MGWPLVISVTDNDSCSVGITGLVVLGGHTKVQDPTANFRNPFEGKTTGYGLTNSLVKIIFSYAGYENAFNIVNEIQASRCALSSRNLLTCAVESCEDHQEECIVLFDRCDGALPPREYCLLCCWYGA